MTPNRLKGFEKLGSCQDCIILSLALLSLSVLLMAVGGIADFKILIWIGAVACAAFVLLLGLHALFFFLKRKKLVAKKPHHGCCGS
jgi:hypothetical protein